MQRFGHISATALVLSLSATAAAQEAPALPPAPPSSPAPVAADADPKPKAKPGIPPELKLNGYVQGRYEWHDDADFGLDPTRGTPRGSSRFFVRRARLKTTYTKGNAEVMVEMGGDNAAAFALLSGEASFVDTWTPLALKLTVGQFKVPFGFEILQSSSEREAPERSLMIRTLFPGERDRGVRLTGGVRALKFALALVNGAGTRDALYGNFDQTSWKDLVGRLQLVLGFLDVGASGYWGHTLATRRATGMPPSYDRHNRLRVGGDLQAKAPIPALGNLELRAEVVYGHDKNLSFASAPADPCKDSDTLGWYVKLVQRLPARLGVAARVDQFDPVSGVETGCVRYASSRTDRTTTWGGGLIADTFANVRLTLWYEHPAEQATTLGNDTFTLQLQGKF